MNEIKKTTAVRVYTIMATSAVWIVITIIAAWLAYRQGEYAAIPPRNAVQGSASSRRRSARARRQNARTSALFTASPARSP